MLSPDREIVSRRPDKTLDRYTYGAFAQRTRRLVSLFQALGVRPGDRIRTTGRLTAINTRGDMELVTFELKAVDEQDHPISDGTALFIIRKP